MTKVTLISTTQHVEYVSDCSTMCREQVVWKRLCCYFQHLQSLQKFFPGSMSKRHLVYLLLFVWRVTAWNTERQIRWPSVCVALKDRVEGWKGESRIKLLNASWKRDKERKQLSCVCLMRPGKTWHLRHLVFPAWCRGRWASQALDANYGNACLSRSQIEPCSLMLMKVLIISDKASEIDTADFWEDWLPVPSCQTSTVAWGEIGGLKGSHRVAKDWGWLWTDG